MFYSVCMNAVFGGKKIAEALPLAAECGAKAFEFWGWWGEDIDAIVKAQQETGLRCAAICTKMVPLNDPARRGEFLDGLRESIPVAQRLGCPTLIAQAGQDRSGVSRTAQHIAIVDGLRAAAPILEEAGITLVLEPLNTLVNHPGYYLARSDEAFEIADEAGSPFVKILFDIYHQQITEGNLIANLTANADKIGHIHAAGNPGRHEMLEGNEIAYPAVLAALKRAGYEKAVGLEYFPTKDAQEGLRELFEAIPIN